MWKIKYIQIQERGLASYMPAFVRNALINRSLLDILCDVWFIPTISMYLKVILAPIFSSHKIRPDEAFKYLEHLDAKHQKVFITKGLAFLMPKKVTKLLLPKNYYENNPIIDNKKIKDDHFLSDVDNSSTETVKLLKNDRAEASPRSRELKQASKNQVQFEEGQIQTENKNNDDFKKKVQTKSKVLFSSKLMKNLQNMPGRIDPKWDNMGEYEKRKRRNLLKAASSDKLNVLKLMLNLKNFHLEKKISKQTVFTAGGSALLIFLIQLLVSRKARRWTRSMILFIIYFSGFSVISLSAGYLGYLRHTENKKLKKEQKRLKQESIAANHSDELMVTDEPSQ